MAATFLGGGLTEGPSVGLGLDPAGNVVVAGRSNSSDYPVHAGAHDENFGGWTDVVVSKLDSTLATLVASTYVGRSDFEGGFVMEVGADGSVYVGGHTTSLDYPTTPGAYDEDYNGGEFDGFVMRMSGDLGTLLASSFLGGAGYDACKSIAVGADGRVYLTGYTNSLDLPTTSAAYDTSFNGGDSDGFVAALDGDLSAGIVSVEPPPPPREVLRLRMNGPNPFTSRTAIGFDLARSGRVRLEILTVDGRVVRSLWEGWKGAGTHSAVWDGADETGRMVRPGVYFCRLTSGTSRRSIKVTVVR